MKEVETKERQRQRAEVQYQATREHYRRLRQFKLQQIQAIELLPACKVHRMQNDSAELILLIHTCLDAVFNADHEYHLHFLCSVSFHVSKRLAIRGCHNAPFMLPKKTQGNIGFLCFNTSFLSKTHTISRFYVKN